MLDRPIEIIKSTELCLDITHGYRRAPIDGIVVHRFGVPGAHDASGVARFCRHETSIGKRMAYSYVVSHCGELVEQALPDDRFGWHCRLPSKTKLAVAVLGDFRTWPPQPLQWIALANLCILLLSNHGLPYDSVVGHSEVPNGSYYDNHQCPGAALEMPVLRKYLQDTIGDQQ